MNGLPDAGTLDALVLGVDGPEDEAAWEALVRKQGGADAWKQAVLRRRRLDLVAGAIHGRPWLARAVGRLLALGRRIRSAPAIELVLGFPDAELDRWATAVLGPAEEQDESEVVHPAWGQVVPVKMRVGERITLQPPTSGDPLDVRYLCNGQEGALPSRTWSLEEGEAPVLLLVLVGVRPEAPLREAMAQATGLAGVLLLGESSAL